MEETQEQLENSKVPKQLQPYMYKKGQSGNPGGRPLGSISMKQYIKNKLLSLSDEEREEFLEGMNKKDILEFGEGKAQQDINANVKATLNIIVPPQIASAFNIDANISTTNEQTIGGDTQQEQI